MDKSHRHKNEQTEVRNKTVYNVLSQFLEVQKQEKRTCSYNSEEWVEAMTAP